MEPATLNDALCPAEVPSTGNKPLSEMEATTVEMESAVVNSSTCVSSEQLMPHDEDQVLPKSLVETSDEQPPPREAEKQPSPQHTEIEHSTEPVEEPPQIGTEELENTKVSTEANSEKPWENGPLDEAAQTLTEESVCKPPEKCEDHEKMGTVELAEPAEPASVSDQEHDAAVLKAEEAAENQVIGRTMVLEGGEETVARAIPTFATPEAAIESLPKLEPELADEQSEDPEAPEQSSRRPNKRNRRESGDSLPSMRPRKESRRPSTRDDDTEPEQHTKTKRRKTLPARQHTSSTTAEADAVTEMSLEAVPDGWKQPLLYFVEGRPYDYSKNKWVHELDDQASQSQSSQKSNDRRNIRWLRLGDLLIKTGAIYLSPSDTGSPGTPNHAEGPTAIVRDLCALVQGGAADPVALHLGAYTALGRANARDHINLKAYKWDSGIGVTRVLKAGNEKEAVQILPLDLIASCLAGNLRAMLSHSDLFPAHLFASPMHLLQFGPSIAIHLAVANRARQLAELIRIFVDSDTKAKVNELEESYSKGVGGTRMAGGRRRMANKAKEHTGLRTYLMSNNDRQQLDEIVESLEKTLLGFRKVTLEDTSVYPAEFESKEFNEGTFVFNDLQVPLLSLSAAAMRTKVYTYYGITPCIIEMWEDALPSKTLKEVTKHCVKEDERWLMAGSSHVFMDFTLSETQEEWILRRGRRETDLAVSVPCSISSARLMRHLLSHPTEDVSETAHNCVLEVTIADQPTKQAEEYSAIVSLRVVKKVSSDEKLVLDAGHPLVSWEELANDESDSDSKSSRT